MMAIGLLVSFKVPADVFFSVYARTRTSRVYCRLLETLLNSCVVCVTGIGTCIWSNGDTYEGEWQEGFAHGQGTCELCVLLCIHVSYIRGCGFDVGVGVGYVCRYVFAY
jgi:hypothetical protein